MVSMKPGIFQYSLNMNLIKQVSSGLQKDNVNKSIKGSFPLQCQHISYCYDNNNNERINKLINLLRSYQI